MRGISAAWFKGRVAELDPASIRREIERFARLLASLDVPAVRVWCSYNPDLPDESPLQSPEQVVAPDGVVSFFDKAVQNGVWRYGDSWNRAGVDAVDGSFSLFLGNDKDITLRSSNSRLLQEIGSAWDGAGYEVNMIDSPRSY